MRVNSATKFAGCPQECVRFSCVYTGSPEDNSFSAATPSGSCELTITNPALLGAIALGTDYYLDFTPIGEGAAE